ncbi:hypothetical protein HS1genome_0427 [Sulfodiicoccus acidiphilus]|uniref:Acetyl-coenzyme A synthetase N-terminal domain-containing protein n=1 Tax=Sulfodiicoccus acidiphilus TaxID=1670455 RepID=A0A348B1I6_9CREN|nr:acetyl-coenzyme A synthetase N-terminal domain-containing protein [Sulfodiicoccus acidiphilus]BBD72038.1 hypothetical protein HS1genome_0427 [Sulfodiicoccus acidiphilus]
MSEEKQTPLWVPGDKRKEESNLSRFMKWLREGGREFVDYDELWEWSVRDADEFWRKLWQFFDIRCSRRYDIVSSGEMPRTRWFIGAKLNFAENLLSSQSTQEEAVVALSESRKDRKLSWGS